MPKIKHWDGTKWVIFDARDSDTLDGLHAADLTPIAHVGSGGAAHSLATTTLHGFMSKDDKAKLDNIQSGAQVNQNAIRTIKVGATNVSSNTAEGTVEFVAGAGVALTPNATTGTVTIAATISPDADKTDGFHASQTVAANTIAVRDANGKVPGSITGDAATVGGKLPTDFSLAGHIHSIATTSANGFMSKEDKVILDGLVANSGNPNSVGSVVVKNSGGTVKGTVSSTTSGDAFTLIEGTGITMTVNATNKTVTIAGISPTHTHDDRYYTESEIDTKLSGKSDTSHNHDTRYLRKDITTAQGMSGDIDMGKKDLTFDAGSTTGISGRIRFDGQTDHYQVYMENYTDTASRLVFYSSDDGDQDYFLFRHKYSADSGTTDLLEIRYSEVDARVPLKQNGNQVWHAGNLAKSEFAAASHNHSASNITSGTLAYARLPVGTSSTTVAAGDHNHDGRYLNVTGDTMTGGLTIKRGYGHLYLVESDNNDKTWHWEVNGGNLSLAETGVATRATFTTGGDLFVSGKEALVKSKSYIYSTSGPSGTSYSTGDIWIQY